MGMITGQALRIERGRLNLTQTELADELGVSLRTVQSWEKGQTVIPLTRYSRIREVLQLADTAAASPNNLDVYSDVELLAEVIRRIAARTDASTAPQSVTNPSRRVTDAAISAMIPLTAQSGGERVDFSDEMVGSLEPVQPVRSDAGRRGRSAHG